LLLVNQTTHSLVLNQLANPVEWIVALVRLLPRASWNARKALFRRGWRMRRRLQSPRPSTLRNPSSYQASFGPASPREVLLPNFF